MSTFSRRVTLAEGRALLDFHSEGFEKRVADAQLAGTVALYNILANHGIAYLADEVGMGKTYQAFGVMALAWRANPTARILVIAPNATVQRGWLDKYAAFLQNNVRQDPTSAVRDALTRRPAHPARGCENLIDLAQATVHKPASLLVARMSSFSGLAGSLGLDRFRKDPTAVDATELAGALAQRSLFVSVAPEAAMTSTLEVGKVAAEAIARVLPAYDLVIVDESQNLRNRGANIRTEVFARFLHLRVPQDATSPPLPRAERAPHVLMLSATPAHREEADIYRQLAFALPQAEAASASQGGRELMRQLFVRRLRQFYGHNKYAYRRFDALRRELGPEHPVEELFLALVQKRLEEVLDRMPGRAAKIGFLETFESYKPSHDLDPVEVEEGDEEATDASTHDGERDTAPDHAVLRQIVQDYRRVLGDKRLPPHPKQVMVEELARRSFSGKPKKVLLFVRRRASVRELARRISHIYDEVLLERLRALFEQRFDAVREVSDFIEQSLRGDDALEEAHDADEEDDRAAFEARSALLDLFSSRSSQSKREALASNRFRQRFNADRPLADVLEENHVRVWFEASGWEGTFEAFVADLDDAVEAAAEEIRRHATTFVRNGALRRTRARLVGQHHALLSARQRAVARGDTRAASLADEQLQFIRPVLSTGGEPGRVPEELEERCRSLLLSRSFWDEARQDEGTALGRLLGVGPESTVESLQRRELLRNILDKNLRMGEGIFLLLAAFLRCRPDTEAIPRTLVDLVQSEHGERLRHRIAAFEDIADPLLPLVFSGTRDELPRHLRTNLPVFNDRTPVSMVMGGSGARGNVIAQFNSSFLPDFVVSTSVFQEGVDLHLSCDEVWHYGLAASPGDLEQRVGRIDRYYSMAHRKLQTDQGPAGALTVTWPYLARSFDEQQVARILERIRRVQPLMDAGLLARTTDALDLDDHLEMSVEQLLAAIHAEAGEQSKDEPFPASPHFELGSDLEPPVPPPVDIAPIAKRISLCVREAGGTDVLEMDPAQSHGASVVWLVWANLPQGARDQPLAVALAFLPDIPAHTIQLHTPLGGHRHIDGDTLRDTLIDAGGGRQGVRVHVRHRDRSDWGRRLIRDVPLQTDATRLTSIIRTFAHLADTVERAVHDREVKFSAFRRPD